MIKPCPFSSAFLSHVHHAYAQTDGTYKWPNSREGDMLRQAKQEIEALHRENTRAGDASATKTIEENKTERICEACGNSIRKIDDRATETLCGFCNSVEQKPRRMRACEAQNDPVCTYCKRNQEHDEGVGGVACKCCRGGVA